MLRQYPLTRVAPFFKLFLPGFLLYSLVFLYHDYTAEQAQTQNLRKAIGVIIRFETRTFPTQTTEHVFAAIRYCVGATCIEDTFSGLTPTKQVQDTITVYYAKDNPYAAQLTAGSTVSELLSRVFLFVCLPFASWLWIMIRY